MTTNGFGAISFKDGGSIEFAKDLAQVIDNFFNKFNFNRVEWYCYADNPAVRGYRALSSVMVEEKLAI